MSSVIDGIGGYHAAVAVNAAYHKAQSSFKAVLASEQVRRDAFTASVAGQDWFYSLRSRYNVSSMGWKQGQRLVSELVGRGFVRNDLKDLGNRVVIMYPPEDLYDQYGNRLADIGANWVELKMDDGFENTTDYMGTLKSSLEHQWQAYNSMVERYGDIYPNEKAYLQEQDKLLGILHGMANA